MRLTALAVSIMSLKLALHAFLALRKSGIIYSTDASTATHDRVFSLLDINPSQSVLVTASSDFASMYLFLISTGIGLS